MGSSAAQQRDSDRSSRPWTRSGFDELGRSTEGRPDPRRAASAGRAPAAAGVRRHPRRRAGERRGADRARAAPAPAAPRRRSPVWLVPAVNPDGLARGPQELRARRRPEPQLPGAHRSSPRTRPAISPARRRCPSRRRGVIADLDRRASRSPRVVAVHAPFACVNYDGPAAAWAEAVAAACGWPARARHRLPDPGVAGELAWASIAACRS